MNVSIIIPVYNEADHLPTMLSQLKREQPNCDVDGNEVIVVDGGSTDDTNDLCRTFCTPRATL